MPSADSGVGPDPGPLVVVLGTGGTIAGRAARAQDLTGYQAGALSAQDLVDAVPALADRAVEAHAVAQLDSSDMDHATWLALAQAVQHHLARPEVAGVVVTHGTDTLEETATFLHHTVTAAKPVVMTAAMRPATAPSPDGPQNLLDAVTLAGLPGVGGVLLAFGGQVLAGHEARKVHGYRLEAFSAGDAGPLALFEDGRLRPLRDWPTGKATHAPALATDVAAWPVVDIVTSHGGARGAVVDALVAAGATGLVLAGSGNGSVHHELLAAARRARETGVRVLRASRCVLGGVVGEGRSGLPSAGTRTPAQARVWLMLEMLLGRA